LQSCHLSQCRHSAEIFMRRILVGVISIVFTGLLGPGTVLYGQVELKTETTAKPSWSPKRTNAASPEKNRESDSDSPTNQEQVSPAAFLSPAKATTSKSFTSLAKSAQAAAAEHRPLSSSPAVLDAVYLNEHGSAKLGPDANCNDPTCASCQERFDNPAGATSAGVLYPQRSSRLWVRPEYLYWWTEGMNVPPLVTTSTAVLDAGVLGRPTTSTLFGGSELNDDWRSGGRLHAGFWLTPLQTFGIEGNLFALEEETTIFQASSPTGTPILARPFFDIQLLAENARLLASPGFSTGSVVIEANTELQGGELLLRHMVSPPSGILTGVLLGYRYARLDDDLRITESLTQGVTTIALLDRFDTENTFHGAEIGFISEARRDRWSGELVVKVALGVTQSDVQIEGATTTTVGAGIPVTTIGGLLAQSSNSGTFEQDDFAVIPELGATVGCNLTERLKVTLGYTFIYWSRVARAGEQIDRDINLPLLPGPNTLRPAFSFVMTDFWAQGVNVGLEYSY
jgi:hypothetical protein